MQKIISLELNESGSWRRVTSFDLADFEDGALEHAAEQLLQMSSSAKIKARLIIPGDTAPLTTWTRVEGWREWGQPA